MADFRSLISHDCAKKGKIMLAILMLALVYAGWRGVAAARESLRALPQRNDDMVFW